MRELKTDVLIVGGSVGGCAAALAVTSMGLQAILTEPTDWIGGQLSSQAVPPDEHIWIERCGCTARYRQFRNAVRAYYRAIPSLSAGGLQRPFSQPRARPGLGHLPRAEGGEAAGLLAAYCLKQRCTPHAVRAEARQLRDFQSLLAAQGIELEWPASVIEESGNFT